MKRNLALAAVALVFLLGAAQAQSPNSVPDQLKAIQSGINDLKTQNASLANKVSDLEAQVASANKGPRHFYLTKANHTGATALSACDVGYHMASLWEIHDPTNLRYNKDPLLSLTADDSGFGPPASAGWIRTGGSSLGDFNFVGAANCKAWTSASRMDMGSLFPWPVSGPPRSMAP